MSISVIGKDGTNIASTTNGVPVFTGDASASPAGVGGVRMFSENDPGTITGTPFLKSPECSEDYRLRVGMDTLLFTDSFNATTQNLNLWSYTFSTLTCTQPGGYLQFGTVQGTANGHGAFMRTFQHFPLVGTAPLAVEFSGSSNTAQLVANEAFYAGFGLPSAAGTIPTDGCWFKMTSAGLFGEVNYNGTGVTQVTLSNSQITLAVNSKFVMVVGEDSIEFWINDVLYGDIPVPSGVGQPFMTASLPVFMQKVCTGVVANTNVIRITDLTVTLMDLATNKTWAEQQAGQYAMGYVQQNGTSIGTTGSTTQFVGTVSTGSTPVATNAAGSNTAANTTGLGGTGQMTAAASAATDFIACSYQNPAGTINLTARNLYIKGIKISTINYGAAVATTPTTLMWSIGFGHTAVSMQTATTASFANNTTHAPNRLHIGFQSAAVGTPVGGMYSPDISLTFATPIVIRPGEFINTFLKQIVGTATASQTILYTVFFDSYWE